MLAKQGCCTLLFAAAVLAWTWTVAAPAGADHSVMTHVSQGTMGGNGAFGAQFYAASPDGSVVLFETGEQLVAADTDSASDYYRRTAGVTELATAGPASTGPSAPNLAGATPDVSAVFFYTADALVATDVDSFEDAYMYQGGATTRLSGGGTPGCFSSQSWPTLWSDDASKVFLYSSKRLVAADTDCEYDLYEYSGGSVSIVHAGPGSTGPVDVSADGSRVFFTTADAIVPEDTDAQNDVYMREGSDYTLISAGGNGPFNATGEVLGGASPTGDRVYFRTSEQLTAADTDTAIDTYLWNAGTVELVTIGPTGGNNGTEAQTWGYSTDGTHVFFSTSESLVAGDTDAKLDLYERTGGSTNLISTGPADANEAFDALALPVGISKDGSRVFFLTRAKLVASDNNNLFDLYQRSGGQTTLAVVVNGASVPGVTPHGISADGTRLFFGTSQSLVSADTDGQPDLYEQSGAVTSLITTGPNGGNGPFAANQFCCFPGQVSDDGSRVFFLTNESLVASDTDGSQDVYSTSVGPPAGYPRPKGATPLRVSLVPAYRLCTAPNRQHGPPLSFGSCNPPAQESSYLTVGTPDANGPAAASIGFAKFETVAGNPSTSADEADVRLDVSITDVRRQGSLVDYTGSLRIVTTLRITDKYSGTGVEAATLGDLGLQAGIPCTATATASGANCELSTTLDAVVPGIVPEGRRSVWAMDKVRVFDGGSDDIPGSAGDDTLFATQGVFVP